jgi:hypothetical protein
MPKVSSLSTKTEMVLEEFEKVAPSLSCFAFLRAIEMDTDNTTGDWEDQRPPPNSNSSNSRNENPKAKEDSLPSS